VRPYRAVMSARFRVLLQYRAAALAGFGTQLFWGLIRTMIFAGFYRSSAAPQPMTYAEVVSYVWLGQAMWAMLPWTPDRDVGAMIRSGNVAYELLRPLDLYSYWYVRAVAMRTAPMVLRAVPMFVVAGLFFGLRAPPSAASGAAWVAAVLASFILGATITNLLTISMFWTTSGEGIAQLTSASVFVFSGMIIPLPLFPDWAQSVVNFLPFRGLVDAPFRVYMGHIPPHQAALVIGHQLAWAAVLCAFGRWTLARGTRRLVVQGG
jgi:ABC-2 type transport system permease protein